MKLYIINNLDFNPNKASYNNIVKFAYITLDGINTTDLFTKFLNLLNDDGISDQDYFYLVDNHGNVLNN